MANSQYRLQYVSGTLPTWCSPGRPEFWLGPLSLCLAVFLFLFLFLSFLSKRSATMDRGTAVPFFGPNILTERLSNIKHGWNPIIFCDPTYSGVPSIVRVCAKRFHPHYSGHPHYMISGLNSAGRRTIRDITGIKHCKGYVQPTRRMTVAQRLCTQQGDRIRCGVSSRMQTPAVVRG